MKLLMMPNKRNVSVDTILVDDQETEICQSGDNVKLKIKGIEEEEIIPGFVLCPRKHPCSVAQVFDAQVIII